MKKGNIRRMEGRVIKFNLVGAIFVLLLIIGAIVGIVVGVSSSKKAKNEKGNDNIENNQGQIEQNQNGQKDVDEDKEYVELITVGEEEREITMKICKGSFGYTMKYDVNDFYINKDIEGKDEFLSLTSDTVYIYVTKEAYEFADMVNDLIFDTSRSEGFANYDLSQIEINNKNAYVEIMEGEAETITNYYVDAGEGCFIIEVHCGKGFRDITGPIIEKMIESFEIV